MNVGFSSVGQEPTSATEPSLLLDLVSGTTCWWTSDRLVVQSFQIVAENIFIYSLGRKHSVNSHILHFRNHFTYWLKLFRESSNMTGWKWLLTLSSFQLTKLNIDVNIISWLAADNFAHCTDIAHNILSVVGLDITINCVIIYTVHLFKNVCEWLLKPWFICLFGTETAVSVSINFAFQLYLVICHV